MTYAYDKTTGDGEQHLATASELMQSGFTIHERHAPAAAEDDALDALFDGGPDLETREGVERALAAVHADRS
jgi:hypothetical protein